MPGKQNIPIWLTMLIGVVAAVIGTLVAGALGVADIRGIGWIELALRVGFAAVGVAIVAGASGRRSRVPVGTIGEVKAGGQRLAPRG